VRAAGDRTEPDAVAGHDRDGDTKPCPDTLTNVNANADADWGRTDDRPIR